MHKKGYYVDRHEDADVIVDRTTYLQDFFENEILEHCWVHLTRYKLHHIKYKKEWCLGDKDAGAEMQKCIDKHRVYYYKEGNIPMVDLHADDIFEYDEHDATKTYNP